MAARKKDMAPNIQRKKEDDQIRSHNGSRKISILSFGYAMRELKQKHAALSELGIKVQSHSDFRSVRTLICSHKQQFAFLLIGPRVPDQERRTLSDLYSTHYPGGKVIFFYRGSIRNGERATALLNERGSPDNLLNFIRATSGDTNPNGEGTIDAIGRGAP
jgi:hypothetical protein